MAAPAVETSVTYRREDIKILAVDDDQVTLKFIEHALSMFQVTCVDHPEKALETLQRQKFDLILLDVHLPGMSGFQFLEKLRSSDATSSIPVILISGTSKDSASASQGIVQGGEDYLYKPISRELLQKRVDSALVNTWSKENIKEYQKKYEQEKKAGEVLAAHLARKDKEISSLKKRVDEMNNLNQEVQGQLKTPIKSVTVEIGRLLCSDINPDVKKQLQSILKSLTESNLYRPAFEQILSDNKSELDPVTRSWLMNEFTGQTLAAGSVPLLKFPEFITERETEDLQKWNFDSLPLSSDELLSLLLSIFSFYNLLERFNIPLTTMKAFLLEVRKLYRSNPYHNFHHAFDVTQTVYSFLTRFQVGHSLLHHEILALLIAALCHDLDHPGFNNAFQINTMSNLAITYNDTSVLEHHHCSTLFRMLKNPEVNILANLESDTFRQVRKVIIACILSTDMAKHFEYVSKLEERMDPYNRESFEDRSFIMQIVIKAADISNIAKEWSISKKWSENLTVEFFNQGDYEKQTNLPTAPYMDRTQTTTSKTTSNFIDFVAFPLFKNLGKIMDQEAVKNVVDAIVDNRRKWDAMLATPH